MLFLDWTHLSQIYCCKGFICHLSFFVEVDFDRQHANKSPFPDLCTIFFRFKTNSRLWSRNLPKNVKITISLNKYSTLETRSFTGKTIRCGKSKFPKSDLFTKNWLLQLRFGFFFAKSFGRKSNAKTMRYLINCSFHVCICVFVAVFGSFLVQNFQCFQVPSQLDLLNLFYFLSFIPHWKKDLRLLFTLFSTDSFIMLWVSNLECKVSNVGWLLLAYQYEFNPFKRWISHNTDFLRNRWSLL